MRVNHFVIEFCPNASPQNTRRWESAGEPCVISLFKEIGLYAERKQ
jgi:hypothetical protein